MFLHLSGGSEFVKCALGHAGEHIDEWIQAILLVLLGKGDHFQAKGQEGTVKEAVHQEHLTWKKGGEEERRC